MGKDMKLVRLGVIEGKVPIGFTVRLDKILDTLTIRDDESLQCIVIKREDWPYLVRAIEYLLNESGVVK